MNVKKPLVIAIILLFFSVSVIPSTGTTDVKQIVMPTTSGDTLYVGGNGTGNYSSIQDAIDDSSSGDTVFVYDDSSPYSENIIIDKSINLIGEDRNTTNIETYDERYVVNISANGVTFSGFTIDNYDWGAFLINSCNNNISNNIILGWNGVGIELSNSNSYNIISNNLFIYNWYKSMQISNSCTDTAIIGNTFLNNVHDITIDDDCHNTTIIGNSLLGTSCCAVIDIAGSDNNIISDNVISPMQYYGYYGIELHSSNGNTVMGNTISNGCGVELKYSHYNDFIGNTIFDCFHIFLWSSSNNMISCNNIINSSRYGIEINNISMNNIIHHNNFFNNSQNAKDKGNNNWDNCYPSGGNFWDDYNGTDDDGDGIGDTAYNISGGDNQDRYPLMEPWGDNLFPIAKFTWTPSLPDPGETILFNASESIDYDGNITLYEWDWDNDGDYDENHTNSTTTHSWSSYGYYPVTLRVTDNDNLTNSKTKTVRVGNYPPCEPSLPIPGDGATNVSIVVDLSWTGGDPDPDKVTFDIYFGNTTPPPKVAGNITHDYNPGILDYNTTYYWQIVAWDNHGASTAGSIWSFATIPACLEVVIVKPVENFFYLRNIRLFPLPRNTIIVGYIDITVNATSDAGVEKVEFYINNKLKMIDFEEPYSYRWRVLIPFRYVIKSVAYGNDGNWASDEIKVWKFF